jgi:DDE superfamily endonuclease
LQPVQYQLPSDVRHPLICFDERPCFLIDDVGGILPMSPGKANRDHYEYQKNGSCCVFLAFEPTRAFALSRSENVAPRVTMPRSCRRCSLSIILKRNPIRLVQDTLNTHTPGSFYEVLPPAQAFALAQKFELHYTPKKGSWLNMAEIEFAALSTQYLDRRIPDLPTLRREVLAWAAQRNDDQTTVEWKFA